MNLGADVLWHRDLAKYRLHLPAKGSTHSFILKEHPRQKSRKIPPSRAWLGQNQQPAPSVGSPEVTAMWSGLADSQNLIPKPHPKPHPKFSSQTSPQTSSQSLTPKASPPKPHPKPHPKFAPQILIPKPHPKFSPQILPAAAGALNTSQLFPSCRQSLYPAAHPGLGIKDRDWELKTRGLKAGLEFFSFSRVLVLLGLSGAPGAASVGLNNVLVG